MVNPDELESLLDAHAESSSAYGQLLKRGEPPSRQDVERARLLVTTTAGSKSPPPNLEVAKQTLHAIRDIPKVDLTHFDSTPAIAALLTSAVVERYRVVPVMRWRDAVVLAVSDLLDDDALTVLRFALQRHFVFVRASGVQIDEAINRLYRTAQEAEELRALTELALEQERHAEQDDERLWRDAEHVAKRAPIVNLVDTLLHEAASMRASDVHIRPGKHEFEVLYRIDGSLVPMRSLRAALLPAVVSRIKILSSLDITERRLPQDGRIRLDVGEQRREAGEGDEQVDGEEGPVPVDHPGVVVVVVEELGGQQVEGGDEPVGDEGEVGGDHQGGE